MKSILFIVVSILFTACSTLEVNVDYDPKYNFKNNSTFSVIYNDENNKKSLLGNRISTILIERLQLKGYKKVDKSKADFYFTVLLDIKNKKEIQIYYENIGFSSISRHRVYIPTRRGLGLDYYQPDLRVRTDTYEYKKGKLVIEAVDVKENTIVWQGIAEDELSKTLSHEERTSYINTIIGELLKDFPSK